MTMELLQGQELANAVEGISERFARRASCGRSSKACAPASNARTKAASRIRISSPATCSSMRDGSAKILDFGIARAVRVHHYDGDDTVFDPSKLAALTPAFASREMLQGDTPEPADDIFSLAVVIYLMLTGRHPYDRVRADEAAKQGLEAGTVEAPNETAMAHALAQSAGTGAQRTARRTWTRSSTACCDPRRRGPGGSSRLRLRWRSARCAVARHVGGGSFGGRARHVDRCGNRAHRSVVERPAISMNAGNIASTKKSKALAALDHNGRCARTGARAHARRARKARRCEPPDFDRCVCAAAATRTTQAGGRFDAGHAVLEMREADRLRALTRSDRFDQSVGRRRRSRTRTVRARIPEQRRKAPNSSWSSAKRISPRIGRALGRGDAARADALIELAQPRVFDPDAFNGFAAKLDVLRKSLARTQAHAPRANPMPPTSNPSLRR